MVSHGRFLRSARSCLPPYLGFWINMLRFPNRLDPDSLRQPQRPVKHLEGEGCRVRSILATIG